MSMLDEIREQPDVIERVLAGNQRAAGDALSAKESTTRGLIAAGEPPITPDAMPNTYGEHSTTTRSG
jgi:hypothetical protein